VNAPHVLARRFENAGKHEFAAIGWICSCGADSNLFLLRKQSSTCFQYLTVRLTTERHVQSQAGGGGAGAVSFRRKKFIELGGGAASTAEGDAAVFVETIARSALGRSDGKASMTVTP
jgi:hypothetical protein